MHKSQDLNSILASLETIKSKLEKFLGAPAAELKNISVDENTVYFTFRQPEETADALYTAEIFKLGDKHLTIDRNGTWLVGLLVTFNTTC